MPASCRLFQRHEGWRRGIPRSLILFAELVESHALVSVIEANDADHQVLDTNLERTVDVSGVGSRRKEFDATVLANRFLTVNETGNNN